MNDNFPVKQIQIIDILCFRYKMIPSFVREQYAFLFMDDNDAEIVFQEIQEIEELSNNLEEAKLKITQLFELKTTSIFSKLLQIKDLQ